MNFFFFCEQFFGVKLELWGHRIKSFFDGKLITVGIYRGETTGD